MTMTTRLLLSLSLTAAAACGSVQSPDDPSAPVDDPTSAPDAQDAPSQDAQEVPPQDAPQEPPPEVITEPRFLGGSVRDERSDQIDFSTGEPVHTHLGEPIALTTTDCATIYKYGYLLDHEPPFGREAQRNPLAMRFQAPNVAPLDASATAYRVVAATGEVLQGWTTITPDPDGSYTVALYRDDIPSLDEAGERRVDVRFRDTAGTEKVSSVCWNMHALAAPIMLGAPQAPDVSSLFAASFTANSQISALVTGVAKPNITSMHIVQPTAEPTSISFALTPPSTTYTKRVVDDYIPVPVTTTWNCGTEGELCDGAPMDPPDVTGSGTLHPTWILKVIDDESFAVVCQGGANLTCELPGRAAGAAPRAFTLYAALSGMSDLSPRSGSTDRSLIGVGYYGFEGPSFDACLASKFVTHTDINGDVFTSWVCMTKARYTEIIALDNATVTFGPATLAARSADGDPLTYLPASTFTTEPMTWDAGDDDLPGPK